jgi:hypothetical protein
MIQRLDLDNMSYNDLKELVNKMKNCANCKQFRIGESLDNNYVNSCLLCGNLNYDLSICGNWELAE